MWRGQAQTYHATAADARRKVQELTALLRYLPGIKAVEMDNCIHKWSGLARAYTTVYEKWFRDHPSLERLTCRAMHTATYDPSVDQRIADQILRTSNGVTVAGVTLDYAFTPSTQANPAGAIVTITRIR